MIFELEITGGRGNEYASVRAPVASWEVAALGAALSALGPMLAQTVEFPKDKQRDADGCVRRELARMAIGPFVLVLSARWP